MSDKTPPAWAIQAARDIQSEDVILDAQIIMENAPDAEALAVALQDCLMCLANSGIYPNVVERGGKVLSQHRARFPKAQETE